MALSRSRCCLYDCTPDLRFAGKTSVSKRGGAVLSGSLHFPRAKFLEELPIVVMIIGHLGEHLGHSIADTRLNPITRLWAKEVQG